MSDEQAAADAAAEEAKKKEQEAMDAAAAADAADEAADDAQDKADAEGQEPNPEGALRVFGTENFRVPTAEDVVVDGEIVGSAPDNQGRSDLRRSFVEAQKAKRDPGMTPAC